jgi:hypothetical protein
MNTTFDDVQAARVRAEQQLLFPANPRALCEQMGLNWWMAQKLHEDGWLSFYPAATPRLDEVQEAEMRFVGTLVVAGCDESMLPLMLGGLQRPYSYDLNRLYYDWATRRWRLLPDPCSPEDSFAAWLDALVASGDAGSLAGILELGQDALARVRNGAAQEELGRPL